MRSILAAVPVAVIVAAAPVYADAQQHVQAAKKAERKGEWQRALDEWKKAYALDVNAEYLIGIGDAYAKLGNTAEAKKSYEAYLADPLALPGNVTKVKAKVAALDAAEPGLPPADGLQLPGAEPPPLGVPTATAQETGKKGKKSKKGGPAEPSLGLPGLPLPDAKTATAEPSLAPPGLELPSPSKKEDKKVAQAAPVLELPGAQPKHDKVVAKADAPATSAQPHLEQGSTATRTVAIAPPPKAEAKKVPDSALAAREIPRPSEGSSANRTVAWISAGVAVAAVGAGGLAYMKGSSAASELTNGTVRGSAANQALIDDANRNHTLGFIGLAGGLVAAGLSAALFAF